MKDDDPQRTQEWSPPTRTSPRPASRRRPAEPPRARPPPRPRRPPPPARPRRRPSARGPRPAAPSCAPTSREADARRADEETAKAHEAVEAAEKEEEKLSRKERKAREKAEQAEAEAARAREQATAAERLAVESSMPGAKAPATLSGANVMGPGLGTETDPAAAAAATPAARRAAPAALPAGRAERARPPGGGGGDRLRGRVPDRPHLQEAGRLRRRTIRHPSSPTRSTRSPTRRRLLVQEEIELAKAEVTEKVTGLAKGAAVGAAAGVFILAGLIYFLHFIALLIADVLGANPWLGYLIVAGFLFLLGGIAGFMASRFFKKGTPPTPQMAIEEAQLIKATLTAPHPATPSTGVAPQPGEGRGASEPSAPRRRSGSRSRPTAPSSALAVEKLRGEVAKATDWRGHLRAHKREVIIGAAVAGFVVGGGIAAFTGLLTGRRFGTTGRRLWRVGRRRFQRRRRRSISLDAAGRAGRPTTRAPRSAREAAIGIATSAPSTPSSVEPKSTATSTMNGCTLTARFWICGWISVFSICW